MANLIFANAIDDLITNNLKDVEQPLEYNSQFKSTSLLDTAGDLLRTNAKGTTGTVLGAGAAYTLNKLDSARLMANYKSVTQAVADEQAAVAMLGKQGIQATPTLPTSASGRMAIAREATNKAWLTPFGYGTEADALRSGRVFAGPQYITDPAYASAIRAKDASELAKVASTTAETALEGQKATAAALRTLGPAAQVQPNYLARGLATAGRGAAKTIEGVYGGVKWLANTPVAKFAAEVSPYVEAVHSTSNAIGTPWESPSAHFYNPLTWNYSPSEWHGRYQKELADARRGVNPNDSPIAYTLGGHTLGLLGALQETGKGAADLGTLYIPSMLGMAPWRHGESGGENLRRYGPSDAEYLQSYEQRAGFDGPFNVGGFVGK